MLGLRWGLVLALSILGCSGHGTTEPVAGAPASSAVTTPTPDGGATPVTTAPPGEPSITLDDAAIAAELQAAGAPGASVAIVKHGKVVLTKGYGSADLDAKRPVTPDTLFMLASISKTFVATALLQLAEKSQAGLAVLDQDVDASGVLPFSVRNPNYPAVPITYRMLLTHTSSLIDGAYFQNFDWPLGDSPVSLTSFLTEYVADPANWSSTAPGTDYAYSNSGASLLGFIVERMTKKNLQAYSTEAIFSPLAMPESSWFLTGIDPTHIAMPYTMEGGQYRATGQYGFPDYPDGQLRTSAAQLARFLIMLAGDGSLDGKRLLAPSTLAEMRRRQLPAPNDYQALMLFYAPANGHDVLGHNGATLGGSTDMWFDPKTGAGWVLLTNGDAYLDGTDAQVDAMTRLNELLARAADAP